MEKYEALKALVAGMETDVQKFYGGNNAAGTRVRKHLQEVKKACQAIRDEVQEIRQSRKEA
ncbi:MAG TPA: histone H1 [Bacteroidia bacterium]